MRRMIILGLLAGTIASAQPSWKNSLKIKGDGYQIKLGGRIHYDINVQWAEDTVNALAGPIAPLTSRFRRVRLYNGGKLYDGLIAYKVQMDFAGSKVKFKDVFIEFNTKKWWLKGIKVGQFKQPLRFEALTSSNHITFIERSYISELTGIRSTGIMFRGDKKKWGYQLAAFFNADKTNDFAGTPQELNYVLRIAFLPVMSEDGTNWLFVGVHGAYWQPKGGIIKWKLRPEVSTLPKVISTPEVLVSSLSSAGLELAFNRGPLSIQAEGMSFLIQGKDLINNQVNDNINSFYAQISYVLTGEHRQFKGLYKGAGGVKPSKPINEGGFGAWEVALRYSQADLRVAGGGGVLQGFTFGVNSYLTSAVKLKLNYVYTMWSGFGAFHGISIRTQIVF